MIKASFMSFKKLISNFVYQMLISSILEYNDRDIRINFLY